MNIRKGVLLAFFLAVGLSAFAQQSAAHVTIRSAAGNDFFCMDAPDRAEGGGVQSYRCHGGPSQRWTFRPVEGEWSALIGNGGLCLDVRGKHSRADGTPVELWRCHFGPNQRFRLTPEGRLVEQASGKCLMALGESNRAPIILDDCNRNPWHGNPYQRWELVP